MLLLTIVIKMLKMYQYNWIIRALLYEQLLINKYVYKVEDVLKSKNKII